MRSATAFFPLIYGRALGDGKLVRIEVPRTALAALARVHGVDRGPGEGDGGKCSWGERVAAPSFVRR